MKIDLKLTPERLAVISMALCLLDLTSAKDREKRATKNVIDILSMRFQKKNIEVNSINDLFTKKKKVKFSLEYHEAHYMEIYLTFLEKHPNELSIGVYELNTIRMIAKELNQKLA